MTLLLARHGQSVWNELRRFQGTTDVALSALGRAQAEALGRAVRGRRLAAAYVSPMQRARETAEIALAGLGIAGYFGAVLPLGMVIALTALELLVAFLQAYVFTILTVIYINDAIHPGH